MEALHDVVKAGKARYIGASSMWTWQFAKMLAGHRFVFLPVRGDKETRAGGFADQFNVGNIKIVKGAWNKELLNELRSFPNGGFDDIVDGGADAFNQLTAVIEWQTS